MAPKHYSRKRQTRKVLLGVLTVVFAAAVVWSAGLFRFAAGMPTETTDTTTRTDAIVVLTGGSKRLSEGLKLLAGNMAGKLFVSGVYHGVDVDRLLEVAQRTPEGFKCCVEIGHSAGDTAGNAAETAVWAGKQKVGSIRIVTSNYHMPRSLLEFREMLPDTTFVPHPVFPDNVKQDRWWAWPGTASLIVGEYNKFLLAWVRLRGARLLKTDKKP